MTIPPITEELESGVIGDIARRSPPPDPPPDVVEFPDWPDEVRLGRRLWILQAPYRYTYELGDWIWRITMPVGFAYDGASIPRIVWSAVQPDKLHKASGPHDLAYRRGGAMAPGEWEYHDGKVWRPVGREMSRKESDQILRIQAKEDPDGPGATQRALAYAAVRVGGRGAWGPKDGPEVP